MNSVPSRLARFASILAAFALAVPAVAQKGVAVSRVVPAPTPWLYRNSDIPPDREWIFGELPNGLRYAVRRNGVPPHQVAIRVAIDAGSLMEAKGEEGFAHFNEHLSFRGSRYVPDGEAKRVFQRLGATFGSDTNAATTPTQTIYKLDIPNASRQGLDDAVRILSGMMAAPEITPAEVAAERRTVLAELREGNGPQGRVVDATRGLFFAGQPLADHPTIGSVAALNAATPDSLRAFHDRWYRPNRTVVVIAGDGDPAVFEALIGQYFADWKPVGANPPDPDFGKPHPDAARTRVLVEPGLPLAVSLAVTRPWFQKNDTIRYNRGKLVDSLAMRIINRRLERRARAGGSYLLSSIDQDDVSRSADATFIQVVPLADDWRSAVRDVRAVIADALVHPPGQAEIDREAAEFAVSLQAAVETSSNDAGAELADTLVEAVNIRETVASDQVARDVFADMHGELTPAAILASTKKLMTGTPMRALLTTPHADPQAQMQLTEALTADVRPGPAQAAARQASFALLPKFGPAATAVKRSPPTAVGVQFVELSNGVRLALFPLRSDVGRTYVSARFGAGLLALPSDRPTPAWAANAALVSSGIGDLGQEELDQLTSARRINMSFDIGDDAFTLRGVTRPADLDDQLKLLAAKLLKPGWDPAPVVRARAAMLT
nr:insulinase family protein [Sphingomonadaceae bacterium]